MKQLFDALEKKLVYNPEPSYVPGTILPFASYKNPDAEPAERGRAVLNVEDNAFHVSAVLEDSDIFNTAKQNNEKTWTTGDVLEFFIQPAGRKDYYELHVTPEQITLQLHIPVTERSRKIEFEDCICDIGIIGKVRKDVPANRWTAEMIVPFSGIGVTGTELDGSRFAICRYNYNKKWEEPEISSTRFFPKGTFHCPPEWHVLVYQK